MRIGHAFLPEIDFYFFFLSVSFVGVGLVCLQLHICRQLGETNGFLLL